MPDALVDSALRRSLVLGELDAETRAAMVEHGVEVSFEPGSELFREGDPCEAVLVLLGGNVRLWRLARSGQLLTLRRCGPGEVLGQMSVLDGSPHSVGATCEDDVRLLSLPASLFRALLDDSPDLARRIAVALAVRVRELSDQLESMKFSSIGERLLGILREQSTGRREIKVTHQQLADRVGSTRENVSRVLALLRDAGVLALGRGSIEVLDHEALDSFQLKPP